MAACLTWRGAGLLCTSAYSSVWTYTWKTYTSTPAVTPHWYHSGGLSNWGHLQHLLSTVLSILCDFILLLHYSSEVNILYCASLTWQLYTLGLDIKTAISLFYSRWSQWCPNIWIATSYISDICELYQFHQRDVSSLNFSHGFCLNYSTFHKKTTDLSPETENRVM